MWTFTIEELVNGYVLRSSNFALHQHPDPEFFETLEETVRVVQQRKNGQLTKEPVSVSVLAR